MLYLSLILSAVLLVAVNRIVARWRNPVPATIGLAVGFAFLPICLMVGFQAVFLQAFFLCILLLIRPQCC